jgi:hypothetical protein
MTKIGSILCVAASLAAMVPAAAGSAACHARTGERSVALVELYTSEGCISCPPADRWLSAAIAPGPTGGAAALAFHVDYWDRLGWKDRFAAAAYTERQYDAMRMNRASFVYTPQVLVGGHAYEGWRSGAPSREIAAINEKPARAHIEADVRTDGDRLSVVADATAEVRRATLFVALADSGHVSDVKAGENAGVRLSHDHVVRRFAQFPLDGALGRARFEWKLPAERGTSPTLVAFVQDAANGDVLQALAVPLADCAGLGRTSTSFPDRQPLE